MHVQHEGAIEQRDSQTSSAYLAEPVLLQLRSIASLSPSDPEVIGDPRHRRYRYWAGEQVLTEGEEGFRPQFVIQGWAFRYRITTGGRRQIFGVLLPGDRLGFDTGPALASIVALTVLQTVDARAALEAARNSSPTLA